MSTEFHSHVIPGAAAHQTRGSRASGLGPADVLRSAGLVRTGEVFDLDLGRWPGMPLFPTEPPFQVLSYRTPHGLVAAGDFAPWTHAANGVVWASDMLIGGSHAGTHIDALGHFAADRRGRSGGGPAPATVGDFGLISDDASAIPPILARGVLVDIARSRGEEVLARGHVITRPECERALSEQGVQIGSGDVVLLRTGYHQVWGTPRQDAHQGAGLGLEAATWLIELGVVAIGSDTEGVEVTPAEDPDSPHPVHIACLAESGVHLLEMVYLEALAAAGHHEFFFVCATPRVKGASGAYARPLAVV